MYIYHSVLFELFIKQKSQPFCLACQLPILRFEGRARLLFSYWNYANINISFISRGIVQIMYRLRNTVRIRALHTRMFPSPIPHGEAISKPRLRAFTKIILCTPKHVKEIYSMLYVLKRLLLNWTKISLHLG